jgi:hypothetical protein
MKYDIPISETKTADTASAQVTVNETNFVVRPADAIVKRRYDFKSLSADLKEQAQLLFAMAVKYDALQRGVAEKDISHADIVQSSRDAMQEKIEVEKEPEPDKLEEK